VKMGMSPLNASLLLLVISLGSLLAGCSTPGIYHPVQSGETLGQIARAYGRSETQLARVNGIDAPQPLQKGVRLFIPGARALRRVPATSPVMKKSRPPSARTVVKSGSSPVQPKKLQSRETAVKKKSGSQVPPVMVSGSFSWPLQGALLRSFDDQDPFPCKGIEIGASPGTPILAAAAGRVIYSGDGISSFGNMIILHHDDDFYTVYAFAQKNLVKVGNFVKKNERIALSGVPPQGRSPRLYFELRHHHEPLNPTFYLP